MITTHTTNPHWSYYIALEDDIQKVARYIEFDISNFCVHSIQLAHLLLASSSEVDVIIKQLCQLIAPEDSAQNINEYKKIIRRDYPSIITQAVVSRKYGIRLTPWSNWKDDENPEWWWAHNKLKHERSNYFQLANLINTLNAIAALLIVNLHFELLSLQHNSPPFPYDLRHVIDNLYPVSELFRLDDQLIYMRE